MLSMTEQVEPREVIFGGTHAYGKQIIAMGESTVMVHGNAEERQGRNPRAWADLRLGRTLGKYRLYVFYDTWVEEYVYGQEAPVGRYPIYSFAWDNVSKLSRILRGEWTHQITTDRENEPVLIEMVPGQEQKVFLTDYPKEGSREYDLMTSFLSRARSSNLRKAKVYIYSFHSPRFALASAADGLVFNFSGAVQNSEVVLYTGRRVSTIRLEELNEARRFIEAVGFVPEELHKAPSDVMLRFCIASARFASYWWDRDTIPLTSISAKLRPDKGGTREEWLGAISEKKLLALQGEMEIA